MRTIENPEEMTCVTDSTLSAFPTIGGDVDAYLSLTVNTNIGTVDLVSATHPALVSLLLFRVKSTRYDSQITADRL